MINECSIYSLFNIFFVQLVDIMLMVINNDIYLTKNVSMYPIFQNNGPNDIVIIPFGTTEDTVKIHFTAEKPNCKICVTVSIIGCFQSACK